jgi:hypothetical protein
MPVTYQRSDVYYEEQDLSQAIAGVSTSIGAIVGAARKGPLGPRLVTTVEEYLSRYGNPDAQVSFMGYAAIAFLQQSNQLWINRVVGANARWGSLALHQEQPNLLTSTPLGPLELVPAVLPDPDANGIPWATVGGTNDPQDNILCFYAEGPGSYSRDISVGIRSDNLRTPTNVQAFDFSTVGVIIAGVDASGSLPAAVYQYAVAAVNQVGETLPAFASVTLPGGVASYITWDAQEGAIGYSVYRLNPSSTNYEYITTVGAADNFFVDKGLIALDGARGPATQQQFTPEFVVDVYDNGISRNNPVESFPCTLRDFTDGMGQQLEIMQQINGISRWIRVQNNVGAFLNDPTIYSVARTALGVGDSGTAVMSSNVSLGWNAFRDDEEVEVRILINGGYAIPAVQLKMDSICHERKDCIAILDVPANRQDAQRAVDYRNVNLNLNSNRSTIYSSDLYIEDEYTGKRLYVPPSGHVAGVYAYTDSTTFPWFAPAGMNRGQLRVLGLRKKYNKGERDNLWKAQVNYIRDFKGLGRVVWEQRTLQAKQSGFSFVNVRRLMDTISIALRRALLFSNFEPNDDFLRLQIRIMIEDYLRVIQQARGIKEFLVVCDDRNNAPYYTDLGQLNVDILIKPVLPAEKIRLRGTLTRQGADFSELIAAGALL